MQSAVPRLHGDGRAAAGASAGRRRFATPNMKSEMVAVRPQGVTRTLILGCALSMARSSFVPPAPAAKLCDLNGDWSVTEKKVVIINGTESLEHIQFFQRPGNSSFTMRTTDWKATISSGTVSSANVVEINMVGGNMQRWYIDSPGCSQLSESSGGPSVWCRFPHCPFPEPSSWPPWSPGVPAPPPLPPLPPPPPPPPEVRTTCGGGYGWGGNGPPCPDPTWAPTWALNLSTVAQSRAGHNGSYVDAAAGAAWGMVTFDWADARSIWQDVHPHNNEALLTEQCRRIKALGTGTKCMVYRQNELAVQWDKSCRLAMTPNNAGMFLRFKTKELCNAAPPCDVAAFHQNSGGRPLIACNRTAPVSAPNCAYCCNLTSRSFPNGVYNEPIGGQWPTGLKPAFGDNALGDGQLFWDFRNETAVQWFAEKVILGAVTGEAADAVDGCFIDDPAGYGQEHPQVQSAVQLTPSEVADLQKGTQDAWWKAFNLLRAKQKYIIQAYRGGPPGTPPKAGCVDWMRQQCAARSNESATIYGGPSITDQKAANLTIAAFLISRGPYSLINADIATIEGRDKSNPAYAIFQLDVGVPLELCQEASTGVFSRKWSKGKAVVDCTADGGNGTSLLHF